MITLDSWVEGYNFGNSSGPPPNPVTYSYTTPSGSNRLLVVNIQTRGTANAVTGVIYNNVSMSAVTASINNGVTTAFMYYLINPSLGSNTVHIVHTINGGSSFHSQAASFSGVNLSSPINATSRNANSDAGPMTTTIGTTVPDSVIVDSCAMRMISGSEAQMTTRNNRIQRTNVVNSTLALRALGSTIIPASVPGDYVMEWTKEYNHQWAIIAAALTPEIEQTSGQFYPLEYDFARSRMVIKPFGQMFPV